MLIPVKHKVLATITEVTIVGGADQECILDIEVTAQALGVSFKSDNNYIYSAKNCPIK